jgi:hypothetical protein
MVGPDKKSEFETANRISLGRYLASTVYTNRIRSHIVTYIAYIRLLLLLLLVLLLLLMLLLKRPKQVNRISAL